MTHSRFNLNASRLGKAVTAALFTLAALAYAPSPIWAATLFNTHTPTLTYPGRLDGQVSAQWEVAAVSSFSPVLVDSGERTSNLSSYKTPFLSDGNYFARVRFWDSQDNLSNWSPPSPFTLDTTPPAAPTLQADASSLTLAGSAYSDALSDHASSRWQVSAHEDFSRTALDSGVDEADLTSYPLTGLTPGSYFARVRYTDDAGNISDWSAPAALAIAGATSTPAPIETVAVTLQPTPPPTPAPVPTPTPNPAPLFHPDQPAGFSNPPAAVAEAVQKAAPPVAIAAAGVVAAAGAISGLSGLVAQTGNLVESLKLLIAGLLPRRRKSWGTAQDKDTDLPVMGATAVLRDREGKVVDSTPTDRFGHFFLIVPQPDSYRVHAEAPGHHDGSPLKIDIGNPDKPPAGLVLSLANATDRPDPKTAAALARLMRVHGFLAFIHYPVLFAGTLLAAYSAYLHHTNFSYLILGLYGLLCLREILASLLVARAYGTVADERTGESLFNAIVTFYRISEEDKSSLTPVRAVNTDQRGRYRLRLHPGSYRLHAEHRGYLFRQAEIDGLRTSQPVSLSIRLVPEASFEGRS